VFSLAAQKWCKNFAPGWLRINDLAPTHTLVPPNLAGENVFTACGLADRQPHKGSGKIQEKGIPRLAVFSAEQYQRATDYDGGQGGVEW
jgi:hypothetical protein